MYFIDTLTSSFQTVTDPFALLVICIGLIIGIFVGAAPGLGPPAALAVMLPFTLSISAEHSIVLLVSVLVGANFGNSLPAALMNIPGTPTALLTVLDAYPLGQRGEAGRALMVALVCSSIGQFVGTLIFALFVVPLTSVALRLLFPEIFAIIVLGLIASATLLGTNLVKGIAAIAFGLLLATPGPDAITGVSRLTFDQTRLLGGLPLLPTLMGLLAMREMFMAVIQPNLKIQKPGKVRVRWLSKEDRKAIRLPLAIGTTLGTIVGASPGSGGTVSTFVTYRVVKALSRSKEEFGKGSVQGLAATETANNSAESGNLIPTLGLGIPGSASMAVILAALAAQGLVVGPQLLATRPSLLYSTFGGLLVASVVLLVIGYLSIWPGLLLLRASRASVLMVAMVLLIMSMYALQQSIFDVWICIVFGYIGYLMTRYDYPVAPAALALILGPLFEANLRRGLVMTGSWSSFISRPITLVLLGIALLLLVVPPIVSRVRRTRDLATATG